MKILLVNDDGYGAPGLMALARCFGQKHQVLICAPDGQRSGFGHSITMHHDVTARRMPLGYAITGTPADCVKIGVEHLMRDCDLVVSGINPGANLGADCNYSGTASAAREAAIQGKTALAASCYCREFRDVDYLAEMTLRAVELLMQNPLSKGVFLNLNMPNYTRERHMPMIAAPMGLHVYAKNFERISESEDCGEIMFRPVFGDNTIKEPGYFDCNLVPSGRAVLTPVSWDATYFPAFHTAQEIADKMKDAGNALA